MTIMLPYSLSLPPFFSPLLPSLSPLPPSLPPSLPLSLPLFENNRSVTELSLVSPSRALSLSRSLALSSLDVLIVAIFINSLSPLSLPHGWAACHLSLLGSLHPGAHTFLDVHNQQGQLLGQRANTYFKAQNACMRLPNYFKTMGEGPRMPDCQSFSFSH